MDAIALRRAGFSEGSIVRIKVKNFLTFSECEVFPGPLLNIVIGPNGTGKSALTHAICLACCGSTGDTGRSTDLTKFVRHGAEGEESFTEVDILIRSTRSDGSDGTYAIQTIRRMINSDTKGSKWFMNGKLVKQSDVKTLVASLNIDVDNLCSFMPQDRVGNFSRFTPREMLENTLLAIENRELYNMSLVEEQKLLSDIERDKDSKRRERDAKQTTLENRKTELSQMKLEMERMQRRQEAIQLKSYYETKLLYVEIEGLQLTAIPLRAEVEQVEQRYKAERLAIAPLETECRNKRRDIQQCVVIAQDATRKQTAFMEAIRVKKENVDSLEEQVHTAASLIQYLDEKRLQDEQQLNQAKLELRNKEFQELRLKEELPSLQQEIDDINTLILQHQERQQAVSLEQKQEVASVTDITRTCQTLKLEKEKLKEFKEIFKQSLKAPYNQRNRSAIDCLAAMDWLEKNLSDLKARKLIRGEVYGPVAMYIDATSPACAAMIEKIVPSAKLYGFITEHDADYHFLRSQFTEMKFKEFDVMNMKNPVISNYKPFNDAQLDGLANINIRGYLCDQFQCPDIIRSFLYVFHGLNTVLWAQPNKTVVNLGNDHLASLNSSFRLFVHVPPTTAATSRSSSSTAGSRDIDVTFFNGKQSRFQKGISLGSETIRPCSVILDRKGNADDISERRAEFNRQIDALEQQTIEKNNVIQALRAEWNNLSNKILQLELEKKRIQQRQQEWRNCSNQVSNCRKRVQDLERILSGGADKERKLKEMEYEKVLLKLFDALDDIASAVKKSNENMIAKAVSDKIKGELEATCRESEDRLEAAQRNVEQLKRELDQKIKLRDTCEKQLRDKEIEFENLYVPLKIPLPQFLNEVFAKVLEMCPEGTPDAILDRIVTLNIEINSSVDNPQLKNKYQNVEAEVRALERDVLLLSSEFDNQDQVLQDRAIRWVNIILNITEKLNNSFSKYMSNLQFKGEVHLVRKGSYNNYELQLRVQFREEAELSDLDGVKHSGGERAVSTIMFLMALQAFSTSPFRVVDEINQGMDESNERLVFDRIVSSCCGNVNNNQYFLVTPKLLQSLNPISHPDVTILLLWNGPGTARKWNFHDNLLLMKKMIKKRAATRDIDATSNDNDDDDEEEEEGATPSDKVDRKPSLQLSTLKRRRRND